jgi:SpoVK/Ycf46/Vps4 family AAA+-type ATPase
VAVLASFGRISKNVNVARADLLVDLVRSGATGDRRGFERATEAIIAEERAQQHKVVASQLAEALRQRSDHTADPVVSPIAGRGQPLDGLVYEIDPERRVADLVLPESVRRACAELVEEHHRRDLLRSFGLEPRHRILLIGPPGSGKTSLAESLATEIMVPLLTVRYEALIGSFLGETAARLQLLFDAVRLRPCVLFFDEFDAVAKERGDTHETGEIKRVVSSLLLQIDRLPSHVIVVAATNHHELLDRAVWRRMQVPLHLPAPTRQGRIAWFEAWEARSGTHLGYAPRTLAERLRELSYAELEDFVGDVRRRLILDGPEADPRSATRSRLEQWTSRAKNR